MLNGAVEEWKIEWRPVQGSGLTGARAGVGE